MIRLILVSLALLVVGCDSYPRDISGTRERVESTRMLRVGIVAGTGAQARVRTYLAALARETGARVQMNTGAAEPLFVRLDADALDLVIAPFREDSPWVDDLALIEPIAIQTEGNERIAIRPAARNGENRWIMLLERTARDQGAAS